MLQLIYSIIKLFQSLHNEIADATASVIAVISVLLFISIILNVYLFYKRNKDKSNFLSRKFTSRRIEHEDKEKFPESNECSDKTHKTDSSQVNVEIGENGIEKGIKIQPS